MFVRFHFPVIHFNIFLILFSYIAPLSYGCNGHDRDALFSISLNFTLAPNSTPLNWSSNVDCCLWQGITCNLNGRVTHLWLPSRNIKGIISPSLQKLAHLSHLNLSHNYLHDPLPDKLFSYLYNLVIVDLSFNQFYQKLPSSSPLPQSIHTVDFSSNYFVGKVQPLFLEFASNLVYFNVSSNGLEGSIPLPTCNYSWCLVKILDFSSNKFTGQIPPALGRFSKLEIFRAGFNLLSGLLPSDIYNLTSLTEISLPLNFLSGPIGEGLGQLSNLTVLEIYGNNFTRSLPKSLTNCTMLIKMDLRDNNLEGDLSVLDFSKLEKLQVLDLGNNKFSNPESIYSCKSLTAIRLSNNPIGGQISSSVLALESLSFLGLSSVGLTNISGAINILSRCKSLRILTLSNNFYEEALPYDLNSIISSGFQNLQVFIFRNCHLMGQIPHWLSKLRSLKVLDLSANQLTGTIPLWLGKMPNLFNIDFSYNLLSGEIPREIATLASLSTDEIEPLSYMELPLFVSRTNIYDTWTSFFIPAINLRNNSFGGFIPDVIGHMKGLHILDLSSNDLSGPIPDRLSNLVALEVLDLSNNRLSGEIPKSLEVLSFISSFNVANNSLQGPIPRRGYFGTFPNSSYTGNPKLCGDQIDKICEELFADVDDDKQGSDEDVEDENFWIYITAIIGFVIGFCMVCIPVACNTTWRNAYFEFLSDANDKLYVILMVYIPRLWR